MILRQIVLASLLFGHEALSLAAIVIVEQDVRRACIHGKRVCAVTPFES